MPASTHLFKVLAVEDPRTLENEIGCMTGIFHMFDRSQAFTGGQRYGSKRVISASVNSRQVSACESPHHDTNNPSLRRLEDNAAAHKVDNLQHIKAAIDQSRDHHRAYFGSSDMVTKPCKAAPVLVDQQHSTDDQKDQQLDQEFTNSEGLLLCHSQENSVSVPDSDQSSVPHHHHDSYPKPLLVSPSDSGSESRVSSKNLRKGPFVDIRDIVRASLHRERSRDSSDGKVKTQALLDLSRDSLLSKSLPRSSSVNGQDRLQMSGNGREEVCCSSSVQLPRSSSVDARRGDSRMLGDWRTTSSLWSSSVESPWKAAGALREKDMSKASVGDSKFAKQFSSPLDVTRLTVELKEHPRLSVSKDEHPVFNDSRNSPRPPAGAQYPESRDPAAAVATTSKNFDFKEPHRSADLKVSCIASCTQKVRDGNQPRLSVDGTRDPPWASMSSRLPVDGRDSPRSGALLPRLKLYCRDSMQSAKLSSTDAHGASQLKTGNVEERGGQGEEAQKHIPNVVARLMGLEELPGCSSDPCHKHPAKRFPKTTTRSSREVRLLQRQLLEYMPPKLSPSPSPPPPMQSEDYNYKQQRSQEFQQLKKPILSHGMQLSIKSSSSSLPGSNQKEMTSQCSLHHCSYDNNLPLQYQREKGFQIHAEEKIGGAHPEVKSPLSLTHNCIAGNLVPPAFKEKDAACKVFQEQQLSQTPAQLSDAVLTALDQKKEETKHPSSQEPLCGLMQQEMHQLRSEKSVQRRTFLRYILAALQVKGPLHSQRCKQSRHVNMADCQTVPKPTVEESKSRIQMLKQQFLPSSPRLKVTVLKHENAHQAARYPGFTAKKASRPEDLLTTIAHHEELLISMKQTNSCAAAVQDTGPIMLGTIPNTLITVPQHIDLDPITNEMTTSSRHPSSPVQPRDLLDSSSSRSGSSGRSAVTNSVQTNTKREHLQLSSSSNGVACKGENGEAAPHRRSPEVHQVQTSLVSSRHEPNGSGSSDTKAASTPRMTRKERIAARSVTGSQDGSQVGWDLSARSPRFCPLPQEKHGLSFPVKEANPLKPSSSSPGVRCMSGTRCPQLMENGKKAAWSKPFRIKDREDSKATLLSTLRAQSTKQELLKGRASSGPDTRRPYQSSSDSKLISQMTEKPTATSAAASTKSQGRRLPISELQNLSSKRSTGKHSIPAVDSKTACVLETETRTAEDTSTKDKIDFLNEDVAPPSVATAADDCIKWDECNMELMMELIQPNAPAAESRLDLPTTLAELDERAGISAVLTPCGVSVMKNNQFAEFGSADVVDQPSPVSVLDNFHFQEEDLNSSPRASKSSTTITAEEDEFDSPQRHNLEETQAAAPKDVTHFIGCIQNFSNHDDLCLNRKNHVEIQVQIDSAPETDLPNNERGICLANKDEEREYVWDILVASGVTENASSINCLQWTTGENMMDLTHFDDLESRWQHKQPPNTKEKGVFETHQISSEKEALARRVLFDGTNEILVQKLDPVRFSPLTGLASDCPQLQRKPAGHLVQDVWDELQDVPCAPSEKNVCDTLYTILHKDLRNTAKQWSGMDGELGHISLEVEHMIVKELIDEIVKDLANGFSRSCNLSTHKRVGAITRRQLFAH